MGYEELQKRIEALEITTDAQFTEIYQALTELLAKNKWKRSRAGRSDMDNRGEILKPKGTSKNSNLCVTLPRQNAHLLQVNSAFASVASLDF